MMEFFNFGTAGGRNAPSFKCIKAIVWIEAQGEAKKERRKREVQRDVARDVTAGSTI